ncbi:hypothetical protein COOONC_25514, partial [Cooperia oncophora]
MNTAIIVLIIAGAAVCQPSGGERFPCGGFFVRPPPPPYLKNLSGEARNEYVEIQRSVNDSIATQMQNILTWAEKYGIESQVQEFESSKARILSEVKQNVTAAISDLSTVLEQYYSIMDNDDQSLIEQRRQFRNL